MILLGIDAFTDRAFSGNPAAVCVFPDDREDAPDEAQMQLIAREMNLSETAFVTAAAGEWHLRWFTPRAEVDLCGHATLAAAHALWQMGCVATPTPIVFQTRSGALFAQRDNDAIELLFPATPATVAAAPKVLCDALSLVPKWSGRSCFDWLLEIENEAQLRALQPDFRLLSTLPTRGVIVTCRSESAIFDFVSRCFFPAIGVDEDPVTGSAHCALAPFWAPRLGRQRLRAAQLSARGGQLETEVRNNQVALIGRAVTVWRGELYPHLAPTTFHPSG